MKLRDVLPVVSDVELNSHAKFGRARDTILV
jgi:hypothetical protein